MRRYSFFHALVMSFFSKHLYRDVGSNWRGTGLLYLFVLLLIVWIPTMIRMHVGLSRFVDEESPHITQQIPRITIKNGQASTDVATPYTIKDKQGSPVAIIDMTSDYQDLDASGATVLLTKTRVFVRNQGRGEIRSYDLQPVGSFEMDRAWAEEFLQILRTWMVPVLFPILLIGAFILRAIQILIYAAIGLLFAKLANTTLSYKTLMRLAAVALTPVLLLNLLLEFLPFSIPFWWVLGTLTGLAYLFFAVKSNAAAAPQAAAPPPPYAPPAMS